uniref:C2H2-type domain-containing protein n=1 Tax=Clytia hemisphaerica TaxID=252671 RepID=A0A7M6DQ95_9CNID
MLEVIAKTSSSILNNNSIVGIDNKKMIAHQRLPVHVEYLQPHITTTESKASPLALLAATCSSIGKTDAEKKDLKTTTTTPTILSKLSPSQDNTKKSSFKPYKLDDKRTPPPSTMRSSPPVLVSNANIVSTKASLPNSPVRITPIRGPAEKTSIITPPSSKDIDEYAKYQEKMNRDLKCHSVSPPLPHFPPRVHMLPHHGPNHNHADCLQCKTVGRPPHSVHSDLHPPPVRHGAAPPPCACAMCRNGDSKCHIGHSPLPGMYHPPPHKGAPLPPPPGMPCRDPACTNCTKLPPKTLQNFVHPALVHQCTHSSPAGPHKGPYPPPPPSVAAYDSYFLKNRLSPHTKPKQHICNWVFEGKQCGSSFVTPEELYQHLRTHTSLQQQRNNENESRASTALSPLPPTHGPIPSPHNQPGVCNIHGCPCGGNPRKTPPRSIMPGYPYGSSAPSGLRYTPYGRPVSAGGNSLPGHFGSHGMYHY